MTSQQCENWVNDYEFRMRFGQWNNKKKPINSIIAHVSFILKTLTIFNSTIVVFSHSFCRFLFFFGSQFVFFVGVIIILFFDSAGNYFKTEIILTR